MARTGIADLPLHGGRCPGWLFPRMRGLGGAIAEAIVNEYGQEEFLRRLSDPFFFQSLGCVLGFDFHSSGLTTTVCGALKEGVKEDTGIFICGGKGKASRKTKDEIISKGEKILSTGKIEKLVYSSRMSAKVDNSAVQDGYQLYHHVFIFTEKGKWSVIQQGLNGKNGYARRYHWLSQEVKSFVEEPQKAICGKKENDVLNMVSRESKEAQRISVDVVNDGDAARLFSGQTSIDSFLGKPQKYLHMPKAHALPRMGRENIETLKQAAEIQPRDYEELLGIRGVGPKTIRSLALVSEIVYGAAPSWKDPVKYSYAHGGKDGIPYPVDRGLYGQSIGVLSQAIDAAKVGRKDKTGALRRLEGTIRLKT